MTHERFEILAHAYGGDIARWPAAERDAAALLMAAEPEFARIVLAAAGELDAALDLWAPLAATATLREAVVASAPAPRRRWGLNAWFLRAGVGAGLEVTMVDPPSLGDPIGSRLVLPPDAEYRVGHAYKPVVWAIWNSVP